MRVLVTSCPNNGHFFPLVPFLWALRNAGHEVLAAVPEPLVPGVAGAGVPAISIGDVMLQRPREHDAPATQDVTDDALVEHVIEFYVPLVDQSVDQLIDIARAWRADLVVHPSWEYAAPIVAQVCGIPSLFHSWGLLPPAKIEPAANEALAPVHRRYGVTGTIAGAQPLWLDVCPPALALHDPVGALPMTYVAYNGTAVLRPWLVERPERPRVCITLGNIPIMGDHDNVVATVIRALAGFDVEVVVAAADRLTVDMRLPANCRIERRLPLSQLLPTCDLAIHHGGAGSTMTSIVTGLPQLVLPQMCVQYQHARRIAEIGAGECLLPGELSVEAVRGSVGRLLSDPARLDTVRKLRDEVVARPRPSAVVANIERALGTDDGQDGQELRAAVRPPSRPGAV